MRKIHLLVGATVLAVLSACVTINVYFPAAAAEEAAELFIGKVIGEESGTAPEGKPPAPAKAPAPRPLGLLSLFISDAHAQADISIQTPAIQAIQARMTGRFKSALEPHYASGAIGLTADGLLAVRDAAKAPLNQRAALNQAVAEDNRDRDAVYREIAVANGHPEWEADIRATFAKQWVEQARAGWYYQDASGAWKQK